MAPYEFILHIIILRTTTDEFNVLHWTSTSTTNISTWIRICTYGQVPEQVLVFVLVLQLY